MSRPTTKPDLMLAANEQFEKLWNLIDTMSEEEKSATFIFDEKTGSGEAHWKRDKNLRDVFIHLYEWHQLLINWVSANQKNEAPCPQYIRSSTVMLLSLPLNRQKMDQEI
jgi:hypothetical protein